MSAPHGPIYVSGQMAYAHLGSMMSITSRDDLEDHLVNDHKHTELPVGTGSAHRRAELHAVDHGVRLAPTEENR